MQRIFSHLSSTLILTLLLVVPTVAAASMVVRTGDTISVADDEVVAGDFYGAGQTVSISGEIEGDALLAGGTVTVNGTIAEDLLIFGGVTQVHASVTDDLRVIGGEVTIAEDIEGDVMVIGGMLKVLSTASISGDLLFFGGELNLQGPVAGSIYGSHDRLRIDAAVGGSVDVTASTVSLGDRAAIEGDVRYTSGETLERAAQAVVVGEVVRNDQVFEVAGISNVGRYLILGLLISLFATLTVYLFSRRLVEQVVVITQTRTLLAPLIGLGFVIFGTFIIALLFGSVLGLLLGVLALFLSVTLTILSFVLAPAVVGGWIVRFIKPGEPLTVQWIFLGGVTCFALLLVPVVGVLVYLYIVFMTLGALALGLYQWLR